MRMLRSVSRLCWMIFLRINWKASTCTAFYIFFRSNNGYPIGRSFVPFIHRNTLQAVERGMSLEEEEESNKHLFPILFPSNNCTIEQVSPSAMAYIGDVVFELFARSRYIWPAKRTTDLQHSVVNLVRAEMQAQLLEQIIHEFPLTFQEQAILKRGRNAAASGRKTFPKRLSPNAMNGFTIALNPNATTSTTNIQHIGGAGIYQDATAFEALLGYLYMTNTTRCNQFLLFVDHKFKQLDL